MNVTEDQARNFWCPMSRVAFPGQSVANRPSTAMMRFAEQESRRTGASEDSRDLQYLREQRGDCNCIASACAFWRFTGYRSVPNGNDEAHGTCGIAADYPNGTGWEFVFKSDWKFDPITGEKIKP